MQTLPILIRNIDSESPAKAYMDFCDGDLCVSIVCKDTQYDFEVSAGDLKILAAYYQAHIQTLGDTEPQPAFRTYPKIKE